VRLGIVNREDKRNTEMSMEDILSSIRKYVSEDDGSGASSQESKNKVTPSESDNEVITLGAENIVNEDDTPQGRSASGSRDNSLVYNPRSSLSTEVGTADSVQVGTISGGKRESPFVQLTKALNACGKTKSLANNSNDAYASEFLKSIVKPLIEVWIEKNMNLLAEDLIMREIEKIKSE
jgi:cell pole-organizing protein PopZ